MLLGGNIELEGFDNLEPSLLVVVKKMVGSEARKISEKGINFDKLKISINSKDDSFSVVAILVFNGNSYDAEVEEKNLFFGIDKALKKLVSAINP
jgi:ribosome-associated translation inhibitor RaiA